MEYVERHSLYNALQEQRERKIVQEVTVFPVLSIIAERIRVIQTIMNVFLNN